MTADADTPGMLDPDAVRAFLRANPDFLHQDAELFSLLAAAPREEGVVDLGQAARERLSAELRQQRSVNEGLVETARANLAGQAQVHMAVLTILEADGPPALDRKLAGRVPGALGVDVVRVLVENHSPLRNSEALLGAADGFIQTVLGDRAEKLGPVQSRYADPLYGPQGARVKSEALIRLELGGRDGLLALAGRDASLFLPEQGTELLSFFARALERMLLRWIEPR
jgi:uncharacterized protein YigA (DUF484 family)